MPWKIVPNHRSCPSSKPYAVVNKDTGRKMGCHDTEESAKKQLAALNANVNYQHPDEVIHLYERNT